MSLWACRVLLTGAAGASLAAQPANDSQQRVEQQRVDLRGAPGMELVASISVYQPGDTLELHLHHGVEAAYVIQGSVVRAPGKAPMELTTGTSLLNQRDIPHAGFTVVGDTPLTIYTVHVVDKGKPLYDYAQ